VVGNHTAAHEVLDAPLTSDIETLAKNVSSWIKKDSSAEGLSADGMAALKASMTRTEGSTGQIATLIVPADACWEMAEGVAEPVPLEAQQRPAKDEISAIAARIQPNSLILLDRDGLLPEARLAAARVAAQIGCRVAMTTFPCTCRLGTWLPTG
jgi:acetolactate synthase-1/2/3 large subunit